MEQAVATLTRNNYPAGTDTTQRRFYLYGTVAIGTTSETYLTGGLPLNFAKVVDSNGNPVILPVSAGNLVPQLVEFFDLSGTGYTFKWNLANNSIQIFVTGTAANDPDNEFGENDIPSAIATATIAFKAEFLKNK